MNLSRIAAVFGLARRIVCRNDDIRSGTSRLNLNYITLEEDGYPFTCLLPYYKEIER
jgi:hypothetical protein